MKKLPIEFQKIIVDKKGYFAEIKFHDVFGIVNNIYPGIVLSFKRPTFDEKQIRTDIAQKRASKFAEGLFTEEMKKKMDEEADAAVLAARTSHDQLPINVALPCDLIEFKYSKRIIKVALDKEALEYFIENISGMNMMYMDINQIFIYGDKQKTIKESIQVIEESLSDLSDDEPKRFIYLKK